MPQYTIKWNSHRKELGLKVDGYVRNPTLRLILAKFSQIQFFLNSRPWDHFAKFRKTSLHVGLTKNKLYFYWQSKYRPTLFTGHPVYLEYCKFYKCPLVKKEIYNLHRMPIPSSPKSKSGISNHFHHQIISNHWFYWIDLVKSPVFGRCNVSYKYDSWLPVTNCRFRMKFISVFLMGCHILRIICSSVIMVAL